MKKILVIICKKIFMSEESYSSFLSTQEEEHGLIENVIVHRCANRPNEMILELALAESS